MEGQIRRGFRSRVPPEMPGDKGQETDINKADCRDAIPVGSCLASVALHALGAIWVWLNLWWLTSAHWVSTVNDVQQWCVFIINPILFALFGWMMGRRR